jgi:glucose dehydrogenase
MKVGGLGAFTIAAGSTVVTDPVDYTFDPTKNFLSSMHFDTTAADAASFSYPISGVQQWTKVSASEAANTTISGYGNNANYLWFITKIEILTNL